MNSTKQLSTFNKILFILIALCPLIAIGNMTVWLVSATPFPISGNEMLALPDTESLPQPILQYGRGHTMTTNAGIHGQTKNIAGLIPALALLTLTNCLIGVWSYTSKSQLKIKAHAHRTPIPNPVAT